MGHAGATGGVAGAWFHLPSRVAPARDLAALEEAGYPLVTERINGQTCWRLLEGFRNVPGLRFAIGIDGAHVQPPSHFSARRHRTSYLAQSALGRGRGRVAAARRGARATARRHVQCRAWPHKRYRQHRETIDRLSRAIANATTVQIRYDSATGPHDQARGRSLSALVRHGGLYLIAFCHLRRELRMFAVERIKSVTPTDHPYQMPLHFDLDAFVQDALTVMRGPRIEVELNSTRPLRPGSRIASGTPPSRRNARKAAACV